MILHISPTYSVPHCGIAKYSKYLYSAIGKLNQLPQIVLEGGLNSIRHSLLTHRPTVCHLQLEYGFCPPERLFLLEEYCREIQTKLVVTYHSLAPMPHNLVPALRLTHTVRGRSEQYGSFERIFSPIPNIPIGDFPKNYLPLKQRICDSQSYLFFGQAHPHKGLLETLVAFKARPQLALVCVVSKPAAGSTDYFDLCKAKAEGMSNVFWLDQYLEDSEVLGVATQCKAAIFPYKEYGAIGTSAAIRLILNTDIPIYHSDTTHFEDLKWASLYYGMPLEEFLQGNPVSDQVQLQKVRAEWSFDNSAKQHLDLYRIW